MASQGYRDWLAAGEPYALIRPAAALQRVLRGHGLTVYDYPNQAHLEANPPEDHTPFSATGWPAANARWRARALDIMPRNDTAAGRVENAAIARRLIADRDAGVPGVAWIKYINWTDEAGVCRQERWTPSHTSRSSTDRGHVHISGRSDVDDDARADTYDPLEEVMAIDLGTPVHIGDYATDARWPDAGEDNTLAGAWLGGYYYASLGYRDSKAAKANTDLILQKLAEPASPVSVDLSDEQLEALADKVVAKLNTLRFVANGNG